MGNMENHIRKICVVTWFNSLNYGTCIQCYALTKYLSNQGYIIFVPESYRYYYGLRHPYETCLRILSKIKQMANPPNAAKNENLNDSFIREGYVVRKKKNTQFAYSYNNIYKISSRRDYINLIKGCDVFITGSDQIWNPGYVTPPYLLSFTNNSQKKIAYGSSIGVDYIPEKLKKQYKKYLSRFNKIGVRELTAQRELEQLLDKEVWNVLDPSFLLTKNEWKEITLGEVKKSLINEKFIFCYFIGKNTGWMTDVRAFAEKNQLKVYCALSESNIVPEYGIPLADIGVQEFIEYLLYASCVITDSFHAAALSINFNKPFAVYKRFEDNENGSQNSRILDLLEKFCLERCLVSGNVHDLNFLLNTFDYTRVNKILEQDRIESKRFLKEAIEE
nr:polysaccharide pyruvyl transferase family protein [uncultured Anaerosporobacter sp.]